MKPFAKCLVPTLGFVAFWLAAASAYAVAPRAYVSVNGNDANTCNAPATPCRTYMGAIAHLTPGGEVIVLDSGTFGGGTISVPVTINAPLGVMALAATPITVDPGPGNAVVLRGLTFQAAVTGSGNAIAHASGTLYIENTVVDGWDYGLFSYSGIEGLFVKGSVFRNQATAGVWLDTGTTAKVAIDNSFFERNGGNGVMLLGGTGRVSDTVFSANGTGAQVQNAGTEFTFQHCELSNNSSHGLFAFLGSTLRVSHSTITRNGFYGLYNNNATLESFSNNVIRGNGLNTNGTITAVTLQ
jgi:hypothetical protein